MTSSSKKKKATPRPIAGGNVKLVHNGGLKKMLQTPVSSTKRRAFFDSDMYDEDMGD